MNDINKVLSTSLCLGITNWILKNDYFKDPLNPIKPSFKQVDNYYRIDYPLVEMTGVSIYMLNSETVSEPQKENGQVAIQITFNLGEQRANRSALIYGNIEMMKANIISNPTFIQKYLSQNYVPGLTYINAQAKADYNLLNSQINNGQGATSIIITLNYKIDIYLNMKALQNEGYDLFSPYIKLYQPVTGYSITSTPRLNRKLNAYKVTPAYGYQATGILLIMSNYVGDGLLLGDNGTVYTSPLITDTVEKTSYKTLYVDTPNPVTGYDSTGMLLLKYDAIQNNSALLFGDNGIIYNVVYDGNDYTPINNNNLQVSDIKGYESNGSIFTRVLPQQGIAALLFGDNNNLYKTIFRS